MSDPLDIAQAHLRFALTDARNRLGDAEDLLRRAKEQVERSEKALSEFLRNKYPAVYTTEKLSQASWDEFDD